MKLTNIPCHPNSKVGDIVVLEKFSGANIPDTYCVFPRGEYDYDTYGHAYERKGVSLWTCGVFRIEAIKSNANETVCDLSVYPTAHVALCEMWNILDYADCTLHGDQLMHRVYELDEKLVDMEAPEFINFVYDVCRIFDEHLSLNINCDPDEYYSEDEMRDEYPLFAMLFDGYCKGYITPTEETLK